MRKSPLRSLTKRRDFELVFKEGLSTASKHLVLYTRPNELNWSRIGLSVSKKIGKAVIRNRIRRLLREAARRVLVESSKNFDFVIVAKKAAAEAGLEIFIKEMKTLSLTQITSYEKYSDSAHKTLPI